ncbi:ribose-phosphate diphosphokinase [Natronoglycomyces albus]|uniref:ribose-phosphate diphosphokinase n=1 Tax=Natronoglycomyces albus TaxID=2811108 RepID=A0A895XP57_9ACTN|nr:ribose-phosphate pyrophosphokinase [Natronoglycomyces albus]QSB04296.1 ribose-phosphate pyrophosphokinase [Natronoglycomyces albus]
MDDNEMVVLGGSASQKLSRSICDILDIPLGDNEVVRFSEGNLFVKVNQNVRGRHVYLVQSTAFPVNDNFMELLFWIDALKRASVASVTVVIPYFSYAKGDKKDEPRVSIRARVCAQAIESAGADRVVTLDLHAPQIQGFFQLPVDDLYAAPVLVEAIAAENIPNLVVVSPDAGFAKKAKEYARRLGSPLAIADKERHDHSETAVVADLIGEVDGRNALIVDDFTISAGTLAEVAEVLRDRGANSVQAAISHGVFTGKAMQRLDDSPIEALWVTDSVEREQSELSAKVRTVSVAPLFAEAIKRIHHRESISSLFN